MGVQAGDRYRRSETVVACQQDDHLRSNNINANNMDAYAEDFAAWESEMALEGALV